jgi:hypothetical protein
MSSILKNPHDEKYRMIKKTNAAIKSKLLSLQGGISDLITHLGYTDVRNIIVYKLMLI